MFAIWLRDQPYNSQEGRELLTDVSPKFPEGVTNTTPAFISACAARYIGNDGSPRMGIRLAPLNGVMPKAMLTTARYWRFFAWTSWRIRFKVSVTVLYRKGAIVTPVSNCPLIDIGRTATVTHARFETP